MKVTHSLACVMACAQIRQKFPAIGDEARYVELIDRQCVFLGQGACPKYAGR